MRAGRRRSASVFVDTNLLLVLLVGALDPDQIARFKRTKAYTRDDYFLLVSFIGKYKHILTTPNVLTEVSNLMGQLSDPLLHRTRTSLARLAQDAREQYLPSKELVLDPNFAVLGLADASIAQAAGTDVTVLTADLPLYQRLSSAGHDVVNFNHLRSGSWQ